jgi:hypothetical protein
MMPEDSQTEAEKVELAPFDLLDGTSGSARAKTAETFLELLGARGCAIPIREARIEWPALIFGILFGAEAGTRKCKGLSHGVMAGSASGQQVNAEATPGGRPVALRFADDARDR